jgi:uncharacterized membrane protein YcjF (UPF0283 family)
MYEEPLEEAIQKDLDQEAYERKKISLKRMTIFIFAVDVVLGVYVVIQLIRYINQLLQG